MHLFFEVQIDVHFNSLSLYTAGFKGMCICFLKFRLTFILTLCLPIVWVSKGCVSVFFKVQIDVHFNSLSSYTAGFKGMCICFLKFRLTFILTLSSYTAGFKGMCICFLKFRLTFILTLCLPILSVSKGCTSPF